MKIIIGNKTLTVSLVDNSSTRALTELLKNGPLTIDMQDYANMEKVGTLGVNLPTNDVRITTKPGDVILYQGELLVIYYKPNTWSFTKLGSITNVNADELKKILNGANVEVTLSL